MPVVLAVDPSLSRTGVAAYSSDTATWKVASMGSPAVGDDYRDLNQRFRELAGRVMLALDTWSRQLGDPDLLVMEGPAFGRDKSPVMGHRLAGFWWKMVDCLDGWSGGFLREPPLLIVPPNNLKKYITGNGNAGKDSTMLAMARLYPTAAIRNNDEADAVGLAALGLRMLEGPVAEMRKMPANHLIALKPLTLPVRP